MLRTLLGRVCGTALAGAVLGAGVVLAQSLLEEFTICPNGCEMIGLADGNQLVAEGGEMPNRARLIAVDSHGDQLALPFVGGLPSGRGAGGAPFGPVAYALDGRTMFIALGESDLFHNGGPSLIGRARAMEFRGCVIRVELSADPLLSGPFVLRGADSQVLLAGGTVTVTDFENRTATFTRIANLGAGAHPSGIATLASVPNEVYVVDSGTRRLMTVNKTTQEVNTLAQFPAAPESLRAVGDHQLLLTLFSDRANGSSVWLLDPANATSQLKAGGRTTAVDAMALAHGLLVLENRSDSQGLGQLLLIDDRGAVQQVLARGINDPTSLGIDGFTGRAFVFSRGDGVIYSLSLPQ